MSKAPSQCIYCDGEGNSDSGGKCGFCKNGIPLDTQENWDDSWGKVLDAPTRLQNRGQEMGKRKV